MSHKSMDIPIAAFAVNVAKEMLQETSESPLKLAHTPSALRRASMIPHESIKHYVADNSVALKGNANLEAYPYTPLTEITESG